MAVSGRKLNPQMTSFLDADTVDAAESLDEADRVPVAGRS